MTNRVPMTLHGYQQLSKELAHLIQDERQKIIQEIERARGYGDLSENAEYHAAKEKQRHIEDRIHLIQRQMANAQVIDVATLHGPNVVFGAVVTILDEDKGTRVTYQIVGENEADVNAYKIAYNSPLGRSLIGKEVGAIAEVKAHSGEKYYAIENVQYGVGPFLLGPVAS